MSVYLTPNCIILHMSAETLPPISKMLLVGKTNGDTWLTTLQSILRQGGYVVEIIDHTRLTRTLKREAPATLGVIIDATAVQYPYSLAALALRRLSGDAVWVAGSSPDGVGMIDAEKRGVSYIQKRSDADYLTAVLQGPRLTLGS